MSFIKKGLNASVIKTMDELEVGKEFTARQFKCWFDGIYGENNYYIDTVMRVVRDVCHFRYQYDHKTRLYKKIA